MDKDKDNETSLRRYFDYIAKYAVDSEFRNFMYKTRTHVLINILLGSTSANDKGFSYEEICNLISGNLASRTTILTILQEGVSLKYFLKSIDNKDKRKQRYRLNIKEKQKILSWSRDMKGIFSNL